VTEAIKTWAGELWGSPGWNALPYIQQAVAKAREVGFRDHRLPGGPVVAVEPWSFRRWRKKRSTMTRKISNPWFDADSNVR